MTYRILSLDGGGSWALLQVAALQQIHGPDAKGRTVLSAYDMVVANSGGSIVLAGLIGDLSLMEIDALFQHEDKRKQIFSPTGSWGDWIMRRFGIGPKYSADAKLTGLSQLMTGFGDRRIQGITQGLSGHNGDDVHILIVGFDYDRNRAAFFRSHTTGAAIGFQGFGSGSASNLTLAQAVHASSNAPINYFDGPARYPAPGPHERYWDGGVTGYNNPCMAGVTEAICLGKVPSDLRVLSIGTGNALLPLTRPNTKATVFETPIAESGLLTDVKKLATSILDDPPDAATFVAHVVTGGPVPAPASGVVDPTGPYCSRVVRLNPLIRPLLDGNPPGYVPPPNWSTKDFGDLAALDMDAVDQEYVDLINRFRATWLADVPINQPLRIDYGTLKVELGHDRLSQAIASWLTVR